jgi:hypothetical protein
MPRARDHADLFPFMNPNPIPTSAGPATLAPPPARNPGPDSPPAELKEVAMQQLHEASEGVKEQAHEAIESAKQTGKDLFESQKGRLAEKLGGYCSALGAARESFDRDDLKLLAEPADRAIDAMKRLQGYLRTSSGERIFRDAGQLARRRPEWVFGALFVAGLACGRFLKAAAPNDGRHVAEGEAPPSSPAPGTSHPAAPPTSNLSIR